MSSRLKRQIEVELAQLEALMGRHPHLLSRSVREVPSEVEVDALTALLHSFYTGVENIFKRIAVELDGDVPSGEMWHVQLLDRMTRGARRRGPVVSEDLRAALRGYLDFRHVFRHAYSFNLHWAKMAPLVAGSTGTFSVFREELLGFVESLEDSSDAGV